MRVEAFEAYLAHAEDRGQLLELIDGEIVEKMPTQKHGRTSALIIFAIELWARGCETLPGWVIAEGRYRLPDDPLNSRLPDISYVTRERGDLVERGAALYMPDLAIEIRSPDQRVLDLREKITYYLANGTGLAWLVPIEERLVEVYRPGEDVLILTERDL
ncbi:MAG: Uma2 family endonuclease, partial [Anaerolineae bacterium]|nr:Uma2 family endonuclease [Anaerolineae bacterium]